jgi:hypothetical protein
MRKAFYAATIAFFGLAGSVQAMPVADISGAAPDITLVAQGCGAGWFRGPHGHCHPAGGPGPARHCWWHNGRRFCN